MVMMTRFIVNRYIWTIFIVTWFILTRFKVTKLVVAVVTRVMMTWFVGPRLMTKCMVTREELTRFVSRIIVTRIFRNIGTRVIVNWRVIGTRNWTRVIGNRIVTRAQTGVMVIRVLMTRVVVNRVFLH